MEDLIKSVTSEVIARTEEDINFFRKTIQDNRGAMVEKIQNNRFERYLEKKKQSNSFTEWMIAFSFNGPVNSTPIIYGE